MTLNLSDASGEIVKEQLALFEPRTEGPDAFDDPSFGSNKSLPLHRWIPWVAGYSSDFVRSVLKRYQPEPGVVLDPFSGVGTTLVEAALMGHHAIGFEINPYAALASRVKMNALKLNPEELDRLRVALRAFYSARVSNGYVPASAPPPGFRTRVGFYSPAVLRKVLVIQDFIASVQDERLREAIQLAFAATMVKYSNYSYEPSLGSRQGAGKSDIEDADVIAAVDEKIGQMVADVRWVRQRPEAPGAGEVIVGSFFDSQSVLDEGVADVLITSPPYVNNYHYIRNTRPHLYWLGFVERPKDTKETGAPELREVLADRPRW